MVNDLLSMAAAGSVIFLLWLALYPLTRKRFSARWHYCALKVVLFFLLFPIRSFLRLWTHLAAFFAPATTFQTESAIAVADLPAVVLPSADIAPELPQPAPSLSLTTADLKLLVILWAAGAAVLLAYKLTAFIRFRHRLFRCCNGQISQENEAVFHACRTELGIQRQVRLLCAPHIQTPLVTGLWRPTVILPDGDFSQDELRYIFLHELTHVKSRDLWVRAASLAAMVIHWYDPLVYLLARRIQTLSEQNCDERVAKPLTHQERYAYGKTILKVAADVTAGTATFAVPMSMRRILERRLMQVLHPKFMSKKRTLIAGVAAVALVVCGTAVALSAKVSVQADETEPAHLSEPQVIPTAEKSSVSDTENAVGVQDEPVCFTESLYDGSHWYGDTTIGNSVPSDMTFVCENVIYQNQGAIVVAGTARKTSANLSAEVYRLCDGEWESVGVYSDISGYNGLFSFSHPIDADGDYGIKIWHDLPNVNMDIACNVIY
jgi:beta-lactamase regulating signal transducer with metallopeptidase domain